jgi:hypothetical protein
VYIKNVITSKTRKTITAIIVIGFTILLNFDFPRAINIKLSAMSIKAIKARKERIAGPGLSAEDMVTPNT